MCHMTPYGVLSVERGFPKPETYHLNCILNFFYIEDGLSGLFTPIEGHFSGNTGCLKFHAWFL